MLLGVEEKKRINLLAMAEIESMAVMSAAFLDILQLFMLMLSMVE